MRFGLITIERLLVCLVSMVVLGNAGCGDSDSTVPALKLNEVFASGASDDWLELHNPSDSDVSLAGVELRDSNSYWVFAGGTLKAGSFLQVICDGSDKLGKTNFKLTSDGEQLSLLAADGTVLDRVVFPALRPDTTWGRVPDGHGAWSALGLPSPGKANVAGSPADGGVRQDGAF